MRIALVNCAVLPEPDPDETPLLGALRAAGHDARTLAWDADPGADGDPATDPGAFDVCFIRATWNYFEHLDRFLAWCDHAATRAPLLNPPDVIRWNAHKRYLAELESKGVPIVPTAFVERATPASASTIARERGWPAVVVKPSVSAGSWGTRLFGAGELDAADAYLAEWGAQRDMMVQRYLPSVQNGGERSLVVVRGELTHAIVKAPRFDDDHESVRARDRITPDERALAARVLDAAAMDTYYARVDVMELDDGSLALSELELIEPSLFFDHGPRALERFVEGVESAV